MRGQGDEAILFLERFSEKKPDDVEVRLKLAQVFLDLQRFDNALAQLKTAERLAPENKRVYYLFARLYKSTGRTETAKQALARFKPARNSRTGGEAAAKGPVYHAAMKGRDSCFVTRENLKGHVAGAKLRASS